MALRRGMTIVACAVALSAAAMARGAAPRYSPADAVRAEWSRRAPAFTPQEVAALPPGDRARLDLSLKRIGAPGAPALLPPELERPTEEAWLARAASARTPQERFTALHFLNRLKSPRALEALRGLTADDAASWPAALHLEGAVARARLDGCAVPKELGSFLDALAKAGKVDPVRAQAARLRLVLAGLERELLPAVEPDSGAALALLDAWNTGPWKVRQPRHMAMVEAMASPSAPHHGAVWAAIGLARPPIRCEWRDPVSDTRHIAFPDQVGMTQRLLEGAGENASPRMLVTMSEAVCPESVLVAQAELGALGKVRVPLALRRIREAARSADPRILSAALPALRALLPAEADALRDRMLEGADPSARGYAVEDLPKAPADLGRLLERLWRPEELDGVQALLGRMAAWQMPGEDRAALLLKLCGHPSWTARLLAFEELKKLDPAASWPEAPPPTARERRILEEAVRLAERGAPVRLRITFSEGRSVVIRLDPAVAPINAANLKLLAEEGFFDGHLVPRVVPDFVVQMGSPLDTMDGGPGYAVRCENSLEWYGPGSVGMALSGKDTGGSQFFITLNAAPHLTGRYTRVGEVEDPDRALRLLDALELGAIIESVEVLEDRPSPP